MSKQKVNKILRKNENAIEKSMWIEREIEIEDRDKDSQIKGLFYSPDKDSKYVQYLNISFE